MTAVAIARSLTDEGTFPAQSRLAIIDIGSNSIRLVVYQGPSRQPAILFNEKVSAGLGKSLVATGSIDAQALAAARNALHRFAGIAREMGIPVRTVATAAVRDASNGETLMKIARDAGLDVELLSGNAEAIAAGHGVISGIPMADGVVGDLGGGSLELVRVAGGQVADNVSFPLGVLRLAALRNGPRGMLDRTVGRLLAEAGWSGAGKDRPFYLVGGSWRSLARLDMHLSDYPLPVLHQYRMTATRVTQLSRTIPHLGKPTLKAVPGLSSGRIPMLANATALLAVLLRHLKSTDTMVSAFGLREGLLFGMLPPAVQREDPLIVATREEGRREGRFPEHGDLLSDWIAPLFDDEPAEVARLRHAACHLADVGWHANPEFRAQRALEVALHGNWVAVDAHGRAQIAQALATSFGAGTASPAPLSALASREVLQRAAGWGMAIRLGQRLSGGTAGPLQRSRLSDDGASLTLHIVERDKALYGDAVEKRHTALAMLRARKPALDVTA